MVRRAGGPPPGEGALRAGDFIKTKKLAVEK
jgi:hypothetical protein